MASSSRQVPDPRRPCLSTGDAARILGCLPITVRRRVERGELDGGQKTSGKWFVYADQLLAPTPSDDSTTVAALQRQLHDLNDAWTADRTRWEAQHREDRNRIATLLALNAATLTAAESYKTASEGSLALVRRSTDVVADFKQASDEWIRVAGMYRDMVATDNMPDDPSEIANLT